MEMSVYNAEKFDRSKWRYVIFVTVFGAVFVLSIFNQNIVWAVLIFFLLGGYFYYTSMHNQLVHMRIDKSGLVIGKTMYSRSSLEGYVLEIDRKTQLLKNIVIITKKGHEIFTLRDDKEVIRDFILSLDKNIPLLDGFEQSAFEKLARRLEL